uniref:Peptidase M16 middle/third domain-containing protein n=1 Tax=Timema genevievae TaxID=629358 RepID=A0A7R9PNE1_TIMGE|nr:unnamed protein product [Timema genevievae]
MRKQLWHSSHTKPNRPLAFFAYEFWNRVWVLELYSGNSECDFEHNSMYALFTVTFLLTDEGMKHLQQLPATVSNLSHLCVPTTFLPPLHTPFIPLGPTPRPRRNYTCPETNTIAVKALRRAASRWPIVKMLSTEVLEALFGYLKLLQTSGPNERYFKEIQTIADLSFRYEEESSAWDYTEVLSENMHFYPPEDYITGSDLFYEYNPQAIENCLEMLVPDKVNIMLFNNNEKMVFDQTEPWFNTSLRSGWSFEALLYEALLYSLVSGVGCLCKALLCPLVSGVVGLLKPYCVL